REALLQLARNARLVLLAARHQLRERQRPVAVTLAFEQDTTTNGWKPIADLAQLPQLLFVIDEDEGRARVLHDVADLFGSVGRIDRDAHGSGVRDAEV